MIVSANASSVAQYHNITTRYFCTIPVSSDWRYLTKPACVLCNVLHILDNCSTIPTENFKTKYAYISVCQTPYTSLILLTYPVVMITLSSQSRKFDDYMPNCTVCWNFWYRDISRISMLFHDVYRDRKFQYRATLNASHKNVYDCWRCLGFNLTACKWTSSVFLWWGKVYIPNIRVVCTADKIKFLHFYSFRAMIIHD
jgi:hypothetical protein